MSEVPLYPTTAAVGLYLGPYGGPYGGTSPTSNSTPTGHYSRTMPGALHQQSDVNYIQVLEKVDFPCTVKAEHLPFKGKQLRAETG